MFNLSVIFATARSTYLSTANFFVILYEQKQLQFVLVIKKPSNCCTEPQILRHDILRLIDCDQLHSAL